MMEEIRELSKEENIKDIITDTAIVVAICSVSDFLLRTFLTGSLVHIHQKETIACKCKVFRNERADIQYA